MKPPHTVKVSREEIAGIIDPEAWEVFDRGKVMFNWEAVRGPCAPSLSKADQILSLLVSTGGTNSSRSQPGYDGERAASATQSLLRLSGFTPFRIVETPDYAEVHAANCEPGHAFALTTSPSFFLELNAIAEGKS